MPRIAVVLIGLISLLVLPLFLGNTTLTTVVPSQSDLQPIIADHNVVHMIMDDLIPESAIITAKGSLHIAYEHTSHGSQIVDGMSGLSAFKESKNGTEGLYSWHDGPENGSLDMDDDAMASYASSAADLGYADWAEATENYLNDEANSDVNVIMWSWCGQVGSYDEQGLIDHYLAPMTELENNFTDVSFVYMTGHVYPWDDGVNRSNEQIRDYCIDNNKILFDFADIESYNPDGNYFGDKSVTDNCDYTFENGTTGNWAEEWQEAHPGEWYSCNSAHSKPLNANLKAYAAWWLWARLSGYEGESTSSTFTTETSESSTTTTTTNSVTTTETSEPSTTTSTVATETSESSTTSPHITTTETQETNTSTVIGSNTTGVSTSDTPLVSTTIRPALSTGPVLGTSILISFISFIVMYRAKKFSRDRKK